MKTADLLKRMHDYDIKMYPYALYCNPNDAKELKEHMPETVILIPMSSIDKGTSYLVDREKSEKEFYIQGFSFLGGVTDEDSD